MLPAGSLDGLLFVAGLMALDKTGLAPRARILESAPFFQDSAREQMADILSKAQKIFAAAGSDLDNVVRALHFQRDLSTFGGSYQEWQKVVGDVGLPFSAIGVSSSLFVPGAELIVDLTGYVPGTLTR